MHTTVEVVSGLRGTLLAQTFDECLVTLSQNSNVPLIETEQDVRKCVKTAADALQRTPMSLLTGMYVCMYVHPHALRNVHLYTCKRLKMC